MTTFNLTTWFVDRHLEEGRGDRTALICGDRQVTYAELAALVNRTGHVLRDLGVRQEERVLLALSDGVEFVATWYAAQKIGAVTAEIYTFLPPKDFAYYLDYTRAGVVIVDDETLDRVREARAELRRPAVAARAAGGGVAPASCGEGEASFDALVAQAPDALDPAPTDARRHRDLEVHDRLDRHAQGVRAPRETPLRSFEHYARGVLDIREDDRRAAGAEAVLRLRARHGGAVPVRRRRRGNRLPGALDARHGSSSSSPAIGRRSSSTCRR